MQNQVNGGMRKLYALTALTLGEPRNRAEIIDAVGANHTITGIINGSEQIITFDGNVGSYVLLIASDQSNIGWLLAVSNGVTLAPV